MNCFDFVDSEAYYSNIRTLHCKYVALKNKSICGEFLVTLSVLNFKILSLHSNVTGLDQTQKNLHLDSPQFESAHLGTALS